MTLSVYELEAAFRRATKSERRQGHIQDARNALRAKGWTQADAARRLGVSAIHLCYVLNGHRDSNRLLAAIDHLPPNPNPA